MMLALSASEFAETLRLKSTRLARVSGTANASELKAFPLSVRDTEELEIG